MLLIPGTLVIWTVTLLSHKEPVHISICAYVDKPISSLNAVFGESQSTMLSAETRSNKDNSFFLTKDRPGFTWTGLASVLCSSTFLYSRQYPRWPALSSIHQKGDSVCLTLQLDDWIALSEMWRIFNASRRHKYINRGIRTEWSNNMCLGILLKVTYDTELRL